MLRVGFGEDSCLVTPENKNVLVSTSRFPTPNSKNTLLAAFMPPDHKRALVGKHNHFEARTAVLFKFQGLSTFTKE